MCSILELTRGKNKIHASHQDFNARTPEQRNMMPENRDSHVIGYVGSGPPLSEQSAARILAFTVKLALIYIGDQVLMHEGCAG